MDGGNSLNTRVNISRRRFLKIAGAGAGTLMVSVHGFAAAGDASSEVALGPFVRLDADGRFVIGARNCEIGQGVMTSMPMLVAEEMDLAWSQVKVEQLPFGYYEGANGPASRFGAQGTGGSSSVPTGWNDLRQAGALMRYLLVSAAAQQWKLDPALLTTAAGEVIAPNGKRLRYAALAAAAANIAPPAKPPALKAPSAFRIIGRPQRVVDAEDIVTGRAKFGIDETLPGALIAVVARCPFLDGGVESVDDSDTRKVPGVREVLLLPAPDPAAPLDAQLAAGVAVLADNTWAALKGRAKLRVKWTSGPWINESSANLRAEAGRALTAGTGGVSVFAQGDFAATRAAAARVLSARYEVPFLAHATMEPPGAVLRMDGQHASLVASLQSPSGASRAINAVSGIPRKDIAVRMTRAGGGFGRRLKNDFVAEAALIAKKTGTPVKLMWTREDDIAHDFYRPFGVHEMTAALDKQGAVLGWSHRCAATPRNYRDSGLKDEPISIGCLEANDFPAQLVEHVEKVFFPIASGMPRGWWRGPIHTFHAFAVQSFVDEVAGAAKRDAVELRLAMLKKRDQVPAGDPDDAPFATARMAAVLERCAHLLGWGKKQHAGLGIACHFTFGGYAAHGFEVAWDQKKGVGKLHIKRAICVTDVGTPINPLGLEAQMMGATIDGISTALNLQITVKDGRVEQSNFHDYPLLRMADAPKKVEVHIMPSRLSPSGAGEIGIPSVAPALANAMFAATGKRFRRLPLLAPQEG